MSGCWARNSEVWLSPHWSLQHISLESYLHILAIDGVHPPEQPGTGTWCWLSGDKPPGHTHRFPMDFCQSVNNRIGYGQTISSCALSPASLPLNREYSVFAFRTRCYSHRSFRKQPDPRRRHETSRPSEQEHLWWSTYCSMSKDQGRSKPVESVDETTCARTLEVPKGNTDRSTAAKSEKNPNAKKKREKY